MESPIKALRVFPFRRTCQELLGSEATDMFMKGIVKNEYAVPHGQNSTSASGLMLSAVS